MDTEQFKVGDEVIITNRNLQSYGKIGMVTRNLINYNMYDVILRDERDERSFKPTSIESFPRQKIF